MCIYKNTFFGQEQSSQGFIIISAALKSQVGFNYFCVNIRKLVFTKTQVLPSGKHSSALQLNDLCKNAHICMIESGRMTERGSHIDFNVDVQACGNTNKPK